MEDNLHGTQAVKDLYKNLTLEEDEAAGLVFEQVQSEGEGLGNKWCLVGRFLPHRPINFIAMKNMMASVWQPVKGVCITNLNSSLYMFQFYHELDVLRVLKDGPWTFEQNLLVVEALEFGMIPQQVPLFHVSFWVQAHDILSGFMSEIVARDIGNFVGSFVEDDPNNFSGAWRSYLRIRIALDIRKPLKKRMKIIKAGAIGSWITFKYEKLPTFCFFCGIIGHYDKFCEKFFDYPDKSVEKLFGVWLRAPPRRPIMLLENVGFDRNHRLTT